MRNIDAPRADRQGSRLIASGRLGPKGCHVDKDRVVAEVIVLANGDHPVLTVALRVSVPQPTNGPLMAVISDLRTT